MSHNLSVCSCYPGDWIGTEEWAEANTNIVYQEKVKSIVPKHKTLEKNGKRIVELDLLRQKIYKDNVASKFSNWRFLQLSLLYGAEQSALKQASAKL